jgi:hypothetical protein
LALSTARLVPGTGSSPASWSSPSRWIVLGLVAIRPSFHSCRCREPHAQLNGQAENPLRRVPGGDSLGHASRQGARFVGRSVVKVDRRPVAFALEPVHVAEHAVQAIDLRAADVWAEQPA